MFQVILREQTPEVAFMKDTRAWLENPDTTRWLRSFTRFLDDLKHTAVGLAANQVREIKEGERTGDRVMHRFFAYRDKVEAPWGFYFNPKIISYMGDPTTEKEGCLTWPGQAIVAKRYPAILVNYFDVSGNQMHCRRLEGLFAQVWQHEVDHLNGIQEQVIEIGGRSVQYEQPKIGRNDPCPKCLENGILTKWKKCRKHNVGRV